ncbi:sugar-phosphatase [Clostridium tagluense]|uniref:sugar-phosphatase n=1 Tax=Clostridium TaxID=1485 RepID=UPI0013E96E19|nr:MULTISPECIES: sugar-phosphatase [Clostridium]MBU3126903.1 sugar-phosphatase [Clostridium tagluense]MBZ9625437.1 sugar-phosphatase [Clostridium sp. FP2]MCB2299442.1 sugar-phosphatase [Clostridium tagluense]MCB2310578.1 sugar-phosphatase [Clostridium tagluense]MCB2315256.1 sugar-phosphatase [Clostridium tagluense]
MYKLIAIDMDGTLLSDEKKISPANYEAIQQARENGVKVVIASGRPLVGFKKYLEQLNLVSEDDYAVAFNGALVQSSQGGEIISKTTLTLQDYKDLYELSKELNVNIHALTETSVISPKDTIYTRGEAEMNGISNEIIAVEDVAVDTTIVKVMFVDKPEIIEEIMQKIPEEVSSKYTVVRSAPFYLEFLDKSVNKGAGVAALAKKLNIKQEEVICIGDAGNDIHMIKYAGLGVAMGNAFPEVKKIANFITKTNEEDGVAYIINKFILNGEEAFAV